MPVLPFATLAPRRCYDSLIVAQVGPRAGVNRVPVLARLQEMAGLSYAHFPVRLGTIHLPGHTAIILAAAAVVLLTVGGTAVAALASHARPAPLDWFARRHPGAGGGRVPAGRASSTTTSARSWPRSSAWPSRCRWPRWPRR